MQEGDSHSLYVFGCGGPNARKAEVWLENTDVEGTVIPGTVQKTIDPYWRIRYHDNQQGDRKEWLCYRAADGSDWEVKVHAHYGSPPPSHTNPYTDLWFEIRRSNYKDHNPRVGEIHVQDWEGRKFKVTIHKITISLPQQPTFNVAKL